MMRSFRYYQDDAEFEFPMDWTMRITSGIWQRVVWQLCTDVSEEPPASIILVDVDGLNGVTYSDIYYQGDEI